MRFNEIPSDALDYLYESFLVYWEDMYGITSFAPDFESEEFELYAEDNY